MCLSFSVEVCKHHILLVDNFFPSSLLSPHVFFCVWDLTVRFEDQRVKFINQS